MNHLVCNDEQWLLLDFLMIKANITPRVSREQIKITFMNDGEMGGFILHYASKKHVGHNYRLAEVKFKDKDGTEVIATLLGEYNMPNELEIWKVNFEALLALPKDISSFY